MRARKRNPYWGGGLDKRQARRVRRRMARAGWTWTGYTWAVIDEPWPPTSL